MSQIMQTEAFTDELLETVMESCARNELPKDSKRDLQQAKSTLLHELVFFPFCRFCIIIGCSNIYWTNLECLQNEEIILEWIGASKQEQNFSCGKVTPEAGPCSAEATNCEHKQKERAHLL